MGILKAPVLTSTYCTTSQDAPALPDATANLHHYILCHNDLDAALCCAMYLHVHKASSLYWLYDLKSSAIFTPMAPKARTVALDLDLDIRVDIGIGHHYKVMYNKYQVNPNQDRGITDYTRKYPLSAAHMLASIYNITPPRWLLWGADSSSVNYLTYHDNVTEWVSNYPCLQRYAGDLLHYGSADNVVADIGYLVKWLETIPGIVIRRGSGSVQSVGAKVLIDQDAPKHFGNVVLEVARVCGLSVDPTQVAVTIPVNVAQYTRKTIHPADFIHYVGSNLLSHAQIFRDKVNITLA